MQKNAARPESPDPQGKMTRTMHGIGGKSGKLDSQAPVWDPSIGKLSTTQGTAMMSTGGGSTSSKVKTGKVATEPPFADAELGRTWEVANILFQPLAAHARGARIHTGPPKLRESKPVDRTRWVHEEKQYSPYMKFSDEAPPVAKSAGPPKLWLPRELHEPKKKGKANSGPKHAYTEKEIKNSHKKLAQRPRWDDDHHIMVSQANDEVQKFVREYFDKPIRKESEGVPKVRELYTMNDRQSGWWDEASPLGEPKHTYLDNCGPWNVGGPKEQQKVSWWRRVVEKSKSAPALKSTINDSRSHLSLTERLADVPAAQATQFWREWVDLSKKRLPVAEESKQRGKKGRFAKRGGWPAPSDASHDNAPDPAATMPNIRVGSPVKEKEEWNNRWSVCVSKDNPHLTNGHRQYFSSAQFLSGAEMGHPGAYLGLNSQKWRDAAKNVTLSPSGPAGRGPIGRRCLLY